jgi:prophage regulatory protein
MTTIRRLVRKPEALSILGDSNTQLYDKINNGLMVPPVKIGSRAVAFPSDELNAIVAARAAGFSKTQMQALVDRLHAQRKVTLSALFGETT